MEEFLERKDYNLKTNQIETKAFAMPNSVHVAAKLLLSYARTGLC